MFSAVTGPNIVTPYLHDVEVNQAAIVANFVADREPTAAYVGWGDGHVEDLMVDWSREEARGTIFGLHEYDFPGTFTVTFTLRGADGWLDSQTLFVTVDGPQTAAGDGPGLAAAADGLGVSDSAVASAALAADPAGPPRVDAVFLDSTAWSSDFRSYNGYANGYPVPAGADQLKALPWTT